MSGTTNTVCLRRQHDLCSSTTDISRGWLLSIGCICHKQTQQSATFSHNHIMEAPTFEECQKWHVLLTSCLGDGTSSELVLLVWYCTRPPPSSSFCFLLGALYLATRAIMATLMHLGSIVRFFLGEAESDYFYGTVIIRIGKESVLCIIIVSRISVKEHMHYEHVDEEKRRCDFPHHHVAKVCGGIHKGLCWRQEAHYQEQSHAGVQGPARWAVVCAPRSWHGHCNDDVSSPWIALCGLRWTSCPNLSKVLVMSNDQLKFFTWRSSLSRIVRCKDVLARMTPLCLVSGKVLRLSGVASSKKLRQLHIRG